MDYPTLLVFVAREAIQLVQNPKGDAAWRTVSVYGTVVLTGTVCCAQLYAEPSIAAHPGLGTDTWHGRPGSVPTGSGARPRAAAPVKLLHTRRRTAAWSSGAHVSRPVASEMRCSSA